MGMMRSRVLITKSLLGLAVAINSPLATAQNPEALKNQLDGAGSLSFTRLTSKGQFRGCELVYKRLFRDYRGHGGEVVAAFGSISANYFDGKAFSLFLKARTALISVADGSLKSFQPSYASMSLGRTLAPFKATEFKCEDDGICIAYTDNAQLELMGLAIQNWLAPGPTITITPTQNGIDTKFSVRDLMNGSSQEKKASAKAYFDYYECMGEVIGKMVESIKK